MDRFVTAAAFEFDIRAGKFTVANAAHVPAMVRSADGRSVSVVGRPSGMPLGILASTRYVEEHHELRQGDVVVLMTDGILEAIEADLDIMSTSTRLLADASGGAVAVHRLFLQTYEERNRGRCADDITLVTLEPTNGPAARRTVDSIGPN
jgi:sigma-B regulation protein RsbU (phosphoserine phosphatase)